jgi:hypothetical protein
MTIQPTSDWPALPLDQWADTAATLHRWMQIVGKVRMVNTPPVNHSWHVTLYVSPRGLTTGHIPHARQPFDMEFDFIRHELVVRTISGAVVSVPLRSRSVASFYAEVMAGLDGLGVPTRIDIRPNELPDATPFDEDEEHASYDPEFASRFWRILVSTDRVLRLFRSSFIGKCSPVHMFWGAADIAVSRFSGRPAPVHPGGVPNLPDTIAREAYSHEVSSAGFWAGGSGLDAPAFYSYAYPEPSGFRDASVAPAAAYYHDVLREFVFPYDAMRQAASPEEALLEFLESTYSAAATLGNWDRAALERRSPSDIG